MDTKAETFTKVMSFLVGEDVTQLNLAIEVAECIDYQVDITDVSDIGSFDYVFYFCDESTAGY